MRGGGGGTGKTTMYESLVTLPPPSGLHACTVLRSMPSVIENDPFERKRDATLDLTFQLQHSPMRRHPTHPYCAHRRQGRGLHGTPQPILDAPRWSEKRRKKDWRVGVAAFSRFQSNCA